MRRRTRRPSPHREAFFIDNKKAKYHTSETHYWRFREIKSAASLDEASYWPYWQNDARWRLKWTSKTTSSHRPVRDIDRKRSAGQAHPSSVKPTIRRTLHYPSVPRLSLKTCAYLQHSAAATTSKHTHPHSARTPWGRKAPISGLGGAPVCCTPF